MNSATLLAFTIYFGFLCFVGIVSSFKTKSSASFMLGNRGLNYWITAIAAHASDMSAWLFMGFPAAIYTQGLVAGWIAVGLVGGMFASWYYVAKKLRLATERYQALTLSTFLEKSFNDTSGAIRLVSSLILLVFFAVYIGAGLTGMGHVFELVFQVPHHVGMAIALAASLLYILFGGFTALAWNHFFQGIFLLGIIALVPLYALYTLGGVEPIIAAAQVKKISLSFIPALTKNNMINIINGTMWGIGYLGMPHVIVNYMGIDNPDNIRRAQYFGMAWLIASLSCAMAVGLVGIGFFYTLANSELVFVQLVKILFTPFITGLVLCAILAATMSTIDTQILVASNALTEDCYKHFLNPSASETQRLWVSRLTILLIASIGYALGAQNSSTVMGLVSYAWSGLGSAFSAIVVAALYDTKTTAQGALFAMLTGALVSGLWPLLGTTILPLIPGVLASTAALFLARRCAILKN